MIDTIEPWTMAVAFVVAAATVHFATIALFVVPGA